MRAWWAVAAGSCLTLALLLAGCFVEGQCQTHEDCPGAESCDLLTRKCRLECETEKDCWVNGMPVGKECISNRCEFRFDERVSAPKFCLDVVNPKSSYFEKNLCLVDLQGKVVLIYFGLMG